MNDQDIAITYWGVLIGINAYPDRPLKGCMQDVQNIKKYLEGKLESVHMDMFTATKGACLEISSLIGDPTTWPTYYNVTTAFEKITTQAKAGDVVYIHYSGHGTRSAGGSEFSNTSTGDLAVVLLNSGKENDVRYLWGPRLAVSLKAMVDKGLKVTLVLDCCFSGSVYRSDDPGIRFLPYDPDIDLKFRSEVVNSADNGTGGPISRDASMLPNWLINPNGYAILAACGPQEVARERKFDGQICGVLSYFLLTTLRECGGPTMNHKDIYRHLTAKFRTLGPQQNPVLYGNASQSFFAHKILEINATAIPIIEKQDSSLELQAGQAHGICDGDKVSLHLLNSSETNSDSGGCLVLAKVTQTRAFTSGLQLLDTVPIHGQTGWIAKPLTKLSLRRFPIQLGSSLPNRDEWLIALGGGTLGVHTDIDKYPFSFHVVLNSNKEYEILDESGQKVLNLPSMQQGHTDINHIRDILEHLANFKLVRELAGKVGDPFRESFSVQIISRNGDIFSPGQLVEAKQDERAKFTFELHFENKGNYDLYFYIYDMGPLWQVENILRGSYMVIPSRNIAKRFTGVLKQKMKMLVPPEIIEKGYLQCEDIIKVFVTSQPTSFDLLELPKLGKSIKRKETSRKGRDGSCSSEDWAALNFIIRTSLN
jgi:hypothetical protein